MKERLLCERENLESDHNDKMQEIQREQEKKREAEKAILQSKYNLKIASIDENAHSIFKKELEAFKSLKNDEVNKKMKELEKEMQAKLIEEKN